MPPPALRAAKPDFAGAGHCSGGAWLRTCFFALPSGCCQPGNPEVDELQSDLGQHLRCAYPVSPRPSRRKTPGGRRGSPPPGAPGCARTRRRALLRAGSDPSTAPPRCPGQKPPGSSARARQRHPAMPKGREEASPDGRRRRRKTHTDEARRGCQGAPAEAPPPAATGTRGRCRRPRRGGQARTPPASPPRPRPVPPVPCPPPRLPQPPPSRAEPGGGRGSGPAQHGTARPGRHSAGRGGERPPAALPFPSAMATPLGAAFPSPPFPRDAPG